MDDLLPRRQHYAGSRIRFTHQEGVNHTLTGHCTILNPSSSNSAVLFLASFPDVKGAYGLQGNRYSIHRDGGARITTGFISFLGGFFLPFVFYFIRFVVFLWWLCSIPSSLSFWIYILPRSKKYIPPTRRTVHVYFLVLDFATPGRRGAKYGLSLRVIN